MQPRVNISEMDFDIAITCLQYLGFPCFDPKLADEAISVFLFHGYYYFQDFATAYWSDYLCSCTSSDSLSPTQIERLASALDKLINRYCIHGQQTGELLDDNSIFSDANWSRIIRNYKLFDQHQTHQQLFLSLLPSTRLRVCISSFKEDD
jgi:hypothetical protein